MTGRDGDRGKTLGKPGNSLTACDRQWDGWHTVGVWCLWRKEDLDDQDDDDDHDEEDNDYDYFDESNDVAVVVWLLELRDGRQVGGQVGWQADSESWGNSSSRLASLAVSQHISLSRSRLQIDPLACNCLVVRGRTADSLMSGRVERDKGKNKAMVLMERKEENMPYGGWQDQFFPTSLTDRPQTNLSHAKVNAEDSEPKDAKRSMKQVP